MRIVEIPVYNFNELSDEVKKKVITNMWHVNIDSYPWWDSIEEDLNNIDCRLQSFDIDRDSDCKITFDSSIENIARNIVENHGEVCKTYKIANLYLDRIDELKCEEGNCVLCDDKREAFEEIFQGELQYEYLQMLRNDYAYQTSDEAIEETIVCNEYEFQKDGSLWDIKSYTERR